ncbi:MAG TPA: D-alanyl-D-alanine carboxypeptidase/D-alanyl-D-alanine-endopeptidase [Phycisphaerales bacterium]|nr:D-alanyl-D-alanine carboxypeptidase/D-alanyl-D-alanine-endopeptidase [Phycisphaerales bacterium]
MDAIAAARLSPGRVGVSVRDCGTNDELVLVQPQSDEDRQFIPASNLKLITSGVAMLALGADYEFKTTLVVQGNRLIIRASGDPALADPVLLEKLGVTTDQFVSTLANSIVAAGSQRIDEVIIDDRVFDRQLVHPDWPADQLSRAYCAPVSGLNFHANILDVYASPAGRIGEAPVVRTDPSAPWLEIDRRNARTVSEGNTQLWIQHGATPTKFLLHGSVRAAIKEPVQVTLKDPGLLFGQLLADALVKRNVGGRAGSDGRATQPVVRFAEAGENLSAPAGMERVVALVRTPLSVVMERCNVDSDNLYAECMLKAAANKLTGQPGSWSNGTAAVRMMIKDRLGPEAASSLIMADGSGLSRNNRVTASLMTRWLSEMSSSPSGELFVDSLAVAGEEGTVKTRFRKSKLETEVRAKSGYIRQVRTLSGFLTEPSTRRRLAFSILVNEVPSGADQRAKDMHERIVELLDTYLASQESRPNPAGEAVGG